MSGIAERLSTALSDRYRIGRELFYFDGLTLMVARLDIGRDITVRSRTPLFDVAGGQYDVFPGDSLFVAQMPPEGSSAGGGGINVIANFDLLLRQLEGRGR